jgi:hypothetical protein
MLQQMVYVVTTMLQSVENIFTLPRQKMLVHVMFVFKDFWGGTCLSFSNKPANNFSGPGDEDGGDTNSNNCNDNNC